jgi:hypothetical protein
MSGSYCRISTAAQVPSGKTVTLGALDGEKSEILISKSETNPNRKKIQKSASFCEICGLNAARYLLTDS